MSERSDLPLEWDKPDLLLAAERTLLSWLRLGLSLVGFGIVLERFDYFLRSLSAPYAAADPAGITHWVGIALIVAGAFVCALPALEFRRFANALGSEAAPRWYRVRLGSTIGLCMAVFGAAVAVFLATALPLPQRASTEGSGAYEPAESGPLDAKR